MRESKKVISFPKTPDKAPVLEKQYLVDIWQTANGKKEELRLNMSARDILQLFDMLKVELKLLGEGHEIVTIHLEE